MTIVDKIIQACDDITLLTGKAPKSVYLGFETFFELKKWHTGLFGVDIPHEDSRATVYGMRVYQVDEKEHLVCV